MKKHFGHTELKAGPETPSLRIVFSEGPLDLRWAHCSLTADFVSGLFAGLATRANVAESSEVTRAAIACGSASCPGTSRQGNITRKYPSGVMR